MEKNILGKYKSVKQLSFGMALYSSTSILGPLLIIGGIGYFLDKLLGTNPWLLIVGVFVAFIVTNFLLFKKVVTLNKWISDQKELRKKTDEEEDKSSIK